MATTAKILLYTHKQYADGTHPVILDLIKDRARKRIGLGYRCKQEDWDEANRRFKKRVPNHLEKNIFLVNQLEKALRIIDRFRLEGRGFSVDEFEAQFRGGQEQPKEVNRNKVFDAFADKIDRLNRSQKVGNCKVYADTQRSFFTFCANKDLTFDELDVVLLESYEVWLRERGCADGGISVRFRTLRALYNDAVKKDMVEANLYPFKKYGVNKLKGEGIKKALTRNEVRLIENLDLEKHPHLLLARHLFVFSYYTRGMNFVDMMKLRWADVSDGRILYVRSKTGKRFSIGIVKPVQEILDYFKGCPSNTEYIFPILTQEGLTPVQIGNRKHKVITKYNQALKEIAQILGIRKNLSSYVSRHSFATNLKYAGVSTSVISESLGHRSQEVTETYLKQFEDLVLDEAVSKLL